MIGGRGHGTASSRQMRGAAGDGDECRDDREWHRLTPFTSTYIGVGGVRAGRSGGLGVMRCCPAGGHEYEVLSHAAQACHRQGAADI